MYMAIQCCPGLFSGSVFPTRAEDTFNSLGSLLLAYTLLNFDAGFQSICEINLQTYIALFYKIELPHFTHVGGEIESKQGKALFVFFSINGISLLLEQFSGSGIKHHITLFVFVWVSLPATVLGICLPSTYKILNHNVDREVMEIKRIRRDVTASTLTSTVLMGYFKPVFSKALTIAISIAELNCTFLTNRSRLLILIL